MKRELKDRLEIVEELTSEVGATYQTEPAKGTHFKVIMHFGGRKRMVVGAASRSDKHALENFRKDVRRELKRLLDGDQ